MTIMHVDLKLSFPEQRLLVTWHDQPLDPVALGLLADGWVHRCVPRSFARASSEDLSRHVYELVRERVHELGFVDLDES